MLWPGLGGSRGQELGPIQARFCSPLAATLCARLQQPRLQYLSCVRTSPLAVQLSTPVVPPPPPMYQPLTPLLL